MGRKVTSNWAIPPNPNYLDITHSDGNRDLLPTNTNRVVDSDGQVNFMQPVELDEGLAIKWRVQVGAALAKNNRYDNPDSYVLRDWPANYQMFLHNKGSQADPRQDVYLFGSTKTAKFRSVPEFIPHAIWLFGDMEGNCDCKYCSKRKSQREITEDFQGRGIIQTTSPGPSSPNRLAGVKRKPLPSSGLRNNPITYAAIQKARLRKPSNFIVPKAPAPVEQILDLQEAHSDTALILRRWHRNDELVWVALEHPIEGPRRDVDIIKAWPAIVEEASTRPETTPSVVLPTQNGVSSFPDYNPESPPWKTTHHTKYKLKLLGTSCSLVTRDDQVLSYQAYLPPTELIAALQEVPLSQVRFDSEYTTNFTPVRVTNPADPFVPPPTFEEATGPYALAIQIASQIAGFWNLTDDWEFKFAFRDDKPVRSVSATDGFSLEQAISAASNSNAINGGPQTSYGTSHISGNRHMTTQELEKAKASSLGMPKAVGQVYSQKNFHGLWWGAERIWTGDLIRLKIGRNAIARNGAPHIVTPAPPSASVLQHNQSSGSNCDPESLGAASRGVFLRLDALFTVDVDDSRGKKKSECRAAGALFELADEDWFDPEEALDKDKSPGPPRGVGINDVNGYTNGISNALPQPSPLKPSALPNPNPAVPVNDTAPHMLSEILPNSTNTVPSNNTFKTPIPVTHYDLPKAPIGYKFRPILEKGYEAVFSLTLLSGRYYPRILSHPLLSEAIDSAFQADGSANSQTAHLWALEGLEAGVMNSVDPIRYKKDRLTMLVDAESNARTQLNDYVESTEQGKANGEVAVPNGDAVEENATSMKQEMDVDRLELAIDPMQVDSQ
ncbi:hypothetical protein BDP27DRAFT_1417405 [Rhodocollybia butyracea]|uniref:Cryptic loci regulator 2 N-terminal domain-containing protein n=1 Tax=Rhodocollybia butyracea TaxID=206335 RepID=A0A9P5UCK7_9AGAR|nr:hypothetical protein BDP27DRAFT_1417405 [Rhodocollybia butyracea]